MSLTHLTQREQRASQGVTTKPEARRNATVDDLAELLILINNSVAASHIALSSLVAQQAQEAPDLIQEIWSFELDPATDTFSAPLPTQIIQTERIDSILAFFSAKTEGDDVPSPVTVWASVAFEAMDKNQRLNLPILSNNAGSFNLLSPIDLITTSKNRHLYAGTSTGNFPAGLKLNLVLTGCALALSLGGPLG